MNTTTLNPAELKLQLQTHLSDDLKEVNRILVEQFRSQSHFINDITEHVSRFRGKQIRPILLLLMQRMFSGQTSREGQMQAAAVELIHTATLVHDDVIDEAETRRHVATVHRRWNTETSVLLGDYLFSKSFHLAASTGDAEACRLIGKATDRTCEGELNQIAARLEQSTSEIDYFRIVRDKTGQLFGLACLLGARAAQATSQQCLAARRIGMRLGMAFQIADDVLDLTQPTATTGKDAGNDLHNGRFTLPLLRAFHLSGSEEERRLITDLVRCGGDRNDKNRDRVNAQLEAGIQSAFDTADNLAERALSDLRRLPQNDESQLLEAIAAFAVARQS